MTNEHSSTVKNTRPWDVALALVMLGAAVVLLLNLARWPVPWYDEGLNLQVARNLVRHGVYGLQHGSRTVWFDPLVTTGPTVILPAAVAFSLLGVGLLQARLVMVAFTMAALLTVSTLARRLFGAPTAVVTTLWLLAFPATPADVSASFLGLSRMVLGEVPALFFISAGLLAWYTALDLDSRPRLVVAGLCFGLAVVTKQQAALVLVALSAMWVVDRCWHGQLRARHLAYPLGVALLCAAAWHVSWIYGPQAGGAESFAQQGRHAPTIALATWAVPALIVSNLGALSASGALTWALPGLLYATFLSRERSRAGIKRACLLVVAAIWLGWFVVGSIGWLRYAFVGTALLAPFTAKLLVDLAGGFSIRRLEGRNLAATLAVALMIALPLQRSVRQIAVHGEDDAVEFSRDLGAMVPAGAAIETIEAELPFLSDQVFTQPALEDVMVTVRHVWFGERYAPGFYEPDPLATHLAIGPLARRTDIYGAYLARGTSRRVHAQGDYELYELAGRGGRSPIPTAAAERN